MTAFQKLKMIWSSRPHHFKFFKGCLPSTLLGPFMNTLTHIDLPNLIGSLITSVTVFMIIFFVFLLIMVSVTVVFDWQGDPESMYTMLSSSHIMSNVVKLRHPKHDPNDGRRQTEKKIHTQVKGIISVFL